nr:MAG TPA: hypothetical protein [Caudoviricetes sp.]
MTSKAKAAFHTCGFGFFRLSSSAPVHGAAIHPWPLMTE